MNPMLVTTCRKLLQTILALTLSLCAVVATKAVAAEAIEQSKTVGPVTVNTTLSPADAVIGDEIHLTISVTAEADVELLMPEFGEALQRYTITEFVPKTQVTSSGSTQAVQEYTLQPATSGKQSIPPILVEFIDNRPGKPASPEDFDAYEILTDRIEFSVQSVLPSDAAGDMLPPMGELQIVQPTSPTRWLAIAVVGLVICCAAVATIAWLRLNRRGKRRSAYEIARSRMDRLTLDRRSSMPSLTVEQFYVEISAVIRQYLEDRFELRAPDLTTDEFLQLARAQSELSPEHQSLLGEFLTQADIVKFAGVRANEKDVDHSITLAERFLEDTRDDEAVVEEPTIVEPPARETADV